MGLDIVLGGLVLVGAVRGWFRGFVIQAIRLGGVVACVYAAAPLRDLARPHVRDYLNGLRPELLDRLLWWTACVLGYVVSVSLASAMVRLYRRQPYGDPDPYRGDQAAGFLLGGAKGLLVAIFLVGAIQHHLPSQIDRIEWADKQLKQSKALVWAHTHRPADQIWAAPPVQNFVAYVQKMGISGPSEWELEAEAEGDGGSEAPPEPVSTAPPAAAQALGVGRPETLQVPAPTPLRSNPNLDPELESIRRDLDAMDRGA